MACYFKTFLHLVISIEVTKHSRAFFLSFIILQLRFKSNVQIKIVFIDIVILTRVLEKQTWSCRVSPSLELPIQMIRLVCIYLGIMKLYCWLKWWYNLWVLRVECSSSVGRGAVELKKNQNTYIP